MELDWKSMWEVFTVQIQRGSGKLILQGLKTTLIIAVLGLLIGIVIGIIIAVTRVVPRYKPLPKILNVTSSIYVGLFRGTPIVVQLLIGYFILMPLLNIKADGLNVAIVIFGLNSGAYVSEIMRSGIQSVDVGQLEAGRAVGLSYPVAMSKVVIPQAIKNILPTLGNEFIVLVKETSVVSFIAVMDLTRAFKNIGDKNYEYIVPYLLLALTYLVIVYFITLIIALLEKQMNKSNRKTGK